MANDRNDGAAWSQDDLIRARKLQEAARAAAPAEFPVPCDGGCPNVALSADGSCVVICDQTMLPGAWTYRCVGTAQECYDAIKRLEVRGAPAIGIFAAYAFYLLAAKQPMGDYASFRAAMAEQSAFLASSRPTAVNLAWALDRMMAAADDYAEEPRSTLLAHLRAEAHAIQDEDVCMCAAIAEHGLSLLEEGMGVITHCNAGPLATSVYGTGLGPLLLGHERGMKLHAYVDETRPLLQGARLTSYELSQAGVDTTLICDNMVSLVMSQGRVGACLTGCDRVAANGDVANKIGTSGLAIIAAHYDVPLYVMCPSSTIDASCASGSDIPIEQRAGDEIKEMFFSQPVAPAEVECFNPSFDVTDHTLVSAIVTEKGICRAPYEQSLSGLF